MARLQVQLVNDSGKVIGYGDRWWTHRVRKGPGGPVLGQKHVGITIACINDSGRILVAHRRHRIFDKVWTLSGDTHPYRMQGSRVAETLQQAAKRCAADDLGVVIRKWTKALTTSYASVDPRDPKYCENELLHLMVTKYDGPLQMNPKNAYELRWVGLAEVLGDSEADLKKEPIDRKYAPFVHALLMLPAKEVKEAFAVNLQIS